MTKVIAYFGFNPSTADEFIDDATVRKCHGFSRRLHASRFIMGNVFAFRATDVNSLARVEDVIGPETASGDPGILLCMVMILSL